MPALLVVVHAMSSAGGVACRRLPDDTPGDVCGPELPFAEVAKHAGAIGDLCDKADCCTFSEIEGWKPFSAYVHVHDQYHCLFDVNGRCARDTVTLCPKQ